MKVEISKERLAKLLRKEHSMILKLVILFMPMTTNLIIGLK